ncbi:unnamed protein product [Sphagnum compactum]
MKHTYSVLPIYEQIIDAVLKFGICKLSEVCSFKLGVPVRPMLAKPTTGVSEVLNKFQDMDFTCEYKYIIWKMELSRFYSRNAEHNTGKFPDTVAATPRFMKPGVTSFVLDCEVVAYDCEKNKNFPVQILSTRARKGVSLSTIKHLYASFLEMDGEFRFATANNSNDLEEIRKFLKDAIDHSVVGEWCGAGVYGAFLLACYDEDRTGFAEAVLEECSTTLQSRVIDQPKSYYGYGETIAVDVWFDEVEVWEVKAAELSISPVHRAAISLVDSSKGISLRFPRLVRLREDKTPVEATSAEQIAQMEETPLSNKCYEQIAELYWAQKINHGTADDNEDED